MSELQLVNSEVLILVFVSYFTINIASRFLLVSLDILILVHYINISQTYVQIKNCEAHVDILQYNYSSRVNRAE